MTATTYLTRLTQICSLETFSEASRVGRDALGATARPSGSPPTDPLASATMSCLGLGTGCRKNEAPADVAAAVIAAVSGVLAPGVKSSTSCHLVVVGAAIVTVREVPRIEPSGADWGSAWLNACERLYALHVELFTSAAASPVWDAEAAAISMAMALVGAGEDSSPVTRLAALDLVAPFALMPVASTTGKARIAILANAAATGYQAGVLSLAGLPSLGSSLRLFHKLASGDVGQYDATRQEVK